MAMTFIASQTLASANGSVIFSNIPQTFTHLQIRIKAKNTGTSGAFDYSWMIVNNSSSYAYHRIWGDGSNVSSGNGTSAGVAYYAEFPTSSSGYANMFGTCIVDILDYTSTSKNKTIKSMFGHDQNGAGRVGMYSGVSLSTSAINSIQFNGNTYAFAAGSRFDLYGISSSSTTGA